MRLPAAALIVELTAGACPARGAPAPTQDELASDELDLPAHLHKDHGTGTLPADVPGGDRTAWRRRSVRTRRGRAASLPRMLGAAAEGGLGRARARQLRLADGWSAMPRKGSFFFQAEDGIRDA